MYSTSLLIPHPVPSIGNALLYLWEVGVTSKVTALVDWVAKKAFFSGFEAKKPTLSLKKARRKEFKKRYLVQKYQPLHSQTTQDPIDFIHLLAPSEKRGGNALILVLNHSYQFFSRSQFEHLLRDGMDIILFNPTRLDCVSMESDLKSVIQRIADQYSTMKFALFGYCLGAHIAAKTASIFEIDGETKIPFIFDRGYGDSQQLAAKVTKVARLSIVREVLNQKYNLRVDRVIEQHKGPMLAITCPQGRDQLLHRKQGTNLTTDVANQHINGKTRVIKIQGDHWSRKDATTWNAIKSFLSENGLLPKDYSKVSEEDFPVDQPGSTRTSRIVYWLLQ